jgi:hypothetical protein
MADLTTLAAVKAYAGVSGSGDDTAISGIVAAVSALIHELVGHDYDGDTITGEVHSGPVSGAVVLEKPVASIGAVVEGETTLDSGAYELESERLLWRKSIGGTIPWANGTRNIAVTYTTTSTVPADLELAAREVCAFMVKQSNIGSAGAARLGLSAQANVDTGSADYFVQALRQLPFASLTLRRFMRVA